VDVLIVRREAAPGKRESGLRGAVGHFADVEVIFPGRTTCFTVSLGILDSVIKESQEFKGFWENSGRAPGNQSPE
jgi:hypothetical protein